MFTGLVEAVGRVRRAAVTRGNRALTIDAPFAPELKAGESVAVNGCCLTVTQADKASFTVEAVETTLKATTLADVRAGAGVNLERALRPDSRLGGHFVQGHVDEVGTVRKVERLAGEHVVTFGVGAGSAALLLPKGSVCVDGVSLTIADAAGDRFTVNVIPHTWENTTFRDLRPGDRVNVEYDLIVKAVRQRVGAGDGR
jgi:riboflavin synthase